MTGRGEQAGSREPERRAAVLTLHRAQGRWWSGGMCLSPPTPHALWQSSGRRKCTWFTASQVMYITKEELHRSLLQALLQAPSLTPNLPKTHTQRHKNLERAQTESKTAGRQLQRSSNMMGYREEARPCGHPHYSLLATDRGQFYSQQSRWPRQLKVTSE